MTNQELANINIAITKEKETIDKITALIAADNSLRVTELTMNITYNKLQEGKNAYKTAQEQYSKQKKRVAHIFLQRLDTMNHIEKLKEAEFHLKSQLKNDIHNVDIIHRLTNIQADIQKEKLIKKELNYTLMMDNDFNAAHKTFEPMYEELERATLVYEIAKKSHSSQKARLINVYELRASAMRALSALEENKKLINNNII